MSGEDWSQWVGRRRRREDDLCAAQVRRVAATFDCDAPGEGAPLPPLWHWAFFHDGTPTRSLGEDGHAARGEFLPPVSLPNRMWAGSRLWFHRPLRVGEHVLCESSIESVVPKSGRSGALVFVTVRHDYSVAGEAALREEQDIVYRGRARAAVRSAEEPGPAQWSEQIQPSEALLFRYSAVTFNAHRIHYDQPFVTGVEGYPGLIVHGPLIATLMCAAFERACPGARLRGFAFRGQRPLFCPHPFRVAGRNTGAGRAEVWAADGEGVASRGEIEFE